VSFSPVSIAEFFMRLGDVDATPFTSRVFVILDIEKSSNIGTGGRVALRSYAAAAHDLLRATPLHCASSLLRV
jgi:hypothetical protein